MHFLLMMQISYTSTKCVAAQVLFIVQPKILPITIKKYKDSIHNTAHLTLTKPSQNMQNMLSFNHQYEYNYNVFRYI